MKTDDKYAGMTVNERLFESGLIDDYYFAINRKNTSKVVSILKKIELDDQNILDILTSHELTNYYNVSDS